MADYQHVMYASRGGVEQVYSELFGDVDQITVEERSRKTGTISGKLGAFLTQISSGFTGELTEAEIHSINFDKEMFKAKKLANEILSDDEIPDISEVNKNELETGQLYRFSCEVETKPFESEIDNQTYIEVVGEIGEVRFKGGTSTENWGRRSHLVQSVRATARGDTYPYQGLMWPLSLTTETENSIECDVNFLLICGPERVLRDEWYEKQ
ncbi:hypothetical protein [Haladaptatus sp. ZSTT2]|uniref:hypothetical protein n=1 Tax=Haladaptatus sp. ZSTT2 TaxID=3120515 RepID=UPI00300F166A